MAKKESINLIDTFAEFKELRNIDRNTMISILEESFRNVLTKIFGSDENYDVIINPDKGDFEIWHTRKVVADDAFQDKNFEISLTDAQKLDSDYEVGEDYVESVDFLSFGRRAVLNLRQILASKLLDIQNDALYTEYVKRVGQIVIGEVSQIWKKEVLLLDDEGNELLLPREEQIPGDYYKKATTVRAVIAKVDNQNNNPKIYVSRTSPVFLERLFELEVPEFADDLIKIHKVVRLPGERAKVAVESFDERIDPVGACVGVKGSRIHGIVRELRNENIDVINYTENIGLYITRALSPAHVTSIELDKEAKQANVYMSPEEISLAIGKNGSNINLASMLTGYVIDVYRDDVEVDEEDIFLDQFNDEIDQWVIDVLKGIGCDTAKNTLKVSREDLIARTDLEEETVDHILTVLRAEFSEDAEAVEAPEVEEPTQNDETTEAEETEEVSEESEPEMETETQTEEADDAAATSEETLPEEDTTK